MACKRCKAVSQSTIDGEVAIHCPGPKNWIALRSGCFRSSCLIVLRLDGVHGS